MLNSLPGLAVHITVKHPNKGRGAVVEKRLASTGMRQSKNKIAVYTCEKNTTENIQGSSSLTYGVLNHGDTLHSHLFDHLEDVDHAVALDTLDHVVDSTEYTGPADTVAEKQRNGKNKVNGNILDRKITITRPNL